LPFLRPEPLFCVIYLSSLPTEPYTNFHPNSPNPPICSSPATQHLTFLSPPLGPFFFSTSASPLEKYCFSFTTSELPPSPLHFALKPSTISAFSQVSPLPAMPCSAVFRLYYEHSFPLQKSPFPPRSHEISSFFTLPTLFCSLFHRLPFHAPSPLPELFCEFAPLPSFTLSPSLTLGLTTIICLFLPAPCTLPPGLFSSSRSRDVSFRRTFFCPFPDYHSSFPLLSRLSVAIVFSCSPLASCFSLFMSAVS